MANNPTIKGDTTVLWGTGGGTEISGIIVSVRNQRTSEMVEVADNDGFTVSAIFFNQKNECEVEIIVQTAYPDLENGDDVTIMGVECIVLNSEKMWEQKGVRKLRVKATKWDGMAAQPSI